MNKCKNKVNKEVISWLLFFKNYRSFNNNIMVQIGLLYYKDMISLWNMQIILPKILLEFCLKKIRPISTCFQFESKLTESESPFLFQRPVSVRALPFKTSEPSQIPFHHLQISVYSLLYQQLQLQSNLTRADTDGTRENCLC